MSVAQLRLRISLAHIETELVDEELEALVEQRAVRCGELSVERSRGRERVAEVCEEALVELLVGERAAKARGAGPQLASSSSSAGRIAQHLVLPQLALSRAHVRAREGCELVGRALAARGLQRAQLLEPELEHQVRELRVGLLLEEPKQLLAVLSTSNNLRLAGSSSLIICNYYTK